MDAGEIILLSGIGSAVAGLLVREAHQFWSWKKTLGGREGEEWARTLRHLRGK